MRHMRIAIRRHARTMNHTRTTTVCVRVFYEQSQPSVFVFNNFSNNEPILNCTILTGDTIVTFNVCGEITFVYSVMCMVMLLCFSYDHSHVAHNQTSTHTRKNARQPATHTHKSTDYAAPSLDSRAMWTDRARLPDCSLFSGFGERSRICGWFCVRCARR